MWTKGYSYWQWVTHTGKGLHILAMGSRTGNVLFIWTMGCSYWRWVTRSNNELTEVEEQVDSSGCLDELFTGTTRILAIDVN